MSKDAAKVGSSRKRNGRNAGADPEGGGQAFAAVMEAAQRSGLLNEKKTSRVAGRVSPKLLAKAKKRTGIKSDSDLILFALANLALEDDFVSVMRRSRGTVDPDLDLGF